MNQSLRSGRSTAVVVIPDTWRHGEHGHPESQQRIDVAVNHLTQRKMLNDRPIVEFELATIASLERVHDPRYLQQLEQLSGLGGGRLDADTYVCADSFEVARHYAGGSVAAVNALLDGEVSAAMVLGRPPGHHASRSRGMGFCLINHVAVAVGQALARGVERIAIVDWDVHHGNGTQDMFYDSRQVLFTSVHQSPFYPGTGSMQEKGRGGGEGFTLNVPMRAGAGDETYRQVFDEMIVPAVEVFQPQLVVISAGYDAHALDPLGGMDLSEEGFGMLMARVMQVAEECADGRVVAVLEGGYNPEALARCLEFSLQAMDGTVEQTNLGTGLDEV